MIVSCRLLEHAYEFKDFLSVVSLFLKNNGEFVFEIPDSSKPLKKGDLGMLCEEHPYYFTKNSFTLAMNKLGLGVSKVKRFPYLGEDALIFIVKKKLETKIVIEKINIVDKSFLHKNHSGHQEGKFHLKLTINSIELKKMSRIESNKKIYKILDINEQKYEYKNMDEAIRKMLKIESLEFSFIDDGMHYELWLNASLERKKLPKPLQVNFFDSTWSMSSGNSIHKIGKLN